MVTLQEQFEKDFPNKEARTIVAPGKYGNSNFVNYDLDLTKYTKLEILYLQSNKITSVKLCSSGNFINLSISYNNLTSVDFLNTISNPKKLEGIKIFNNNIQPTDISIFSRFVNLECLKIGSIEKGKVN